MKVELRYFWKYLDQYIYRSDKFWTLKNVKNIETLSLLIIRPMKVVLRYF